MSYNATENSASRRIATLLDEGSFVEIGGAVTARSTDFQLAGEGRLLLTVLSLDME